MRSLVRLAPLALFVAAGAVVAAPARVYEVVDLGDYGPGWYRATAISESGYVTGDHNPRVGGSLQNSRAFLYTPDLGMVDMNQYQGFYTTYAHAIAENGVIGAFTYADNDSSPLLSYGLASGWQHLGEYGPGGAGWLLGMPNGFGDDGNLASFDRGWILDRAGDEAFHVTDYVNGYSSDVPTRGDGGVTWSLNQTVQMKGGNLIGRGLYEGPGASGAFEPYMWTPEHGFVRLGQSLDVDESDAVAVSANGYVAFETAVYPDGYDPGGGPQPVRGTIKIPDPVFPEFGSIIGKVDPITGAITNQRSYGEVFEITGVNNWGHGVGLGVDDQFNTPAAIFRDGRQQFVQDAIQKMSPEWTIGELTDINSRGMIVGTGVTDGGEFRAVMLQLAAAPHQVQNDVRLPWKERWGNDTLLGQQGWTIGRYGCFLTSTSMLLNTFGHSVNPAQLNNTLTPYMSNSPGLMTFGNFPRQAGYLGQDDGVEGLPVTFRHHTFSGADKTALEGEIRNLIWEHGPVILRIPTGGGDNHAVVAYRVDLNGDILVRNPGSYESGLPIGDADRLTLDQYVAFEATNLAAGSGLAGDLSWLRGSASTYAIVTEQDEMSGVMHSPVEFVVTDPTGRRLGFDPTANGGLGAYYDEIPDSAYLRLANVAAADMPGGPGAGDGTYMPIDWYIGDMIEGDYSFELFAIDEGEWTMAFGISDIEGFDPDEFVFGGDTADLIGEDARFSVTYTPVPAPAGAALFAVSTCFAARRRR